MTGNRDDKSNGSDFEARLRRARAAAGLPEPDAKAGSGGGDPMPKSMLGMGFRVGVDLLAGLLVGLGVGYMLDRWAGTRPWGLVIFLLLGAAGGMMNVFRTLRGLGFAIGYRAAPGDKPASSSQTGSTGDKDGGPAA
jgi:ATP synthase protein I